MNDASNLVQLLPESKPATAQAENDNLTSISLDWLPPGFMGHVDWFGRPSIWKGSSEDGGGLKPEEFVCAPFEPVCRYSDEHGEGQGVEIRFVDMDSGKARHVRVDRENLHFESGEVYRLCAGRGMVISTTEKGHGYFKMLLNGLYPDQRQTVVTRAGFHDGLGFVTPLGEGIGTPGGQMVGIADRSALKNSKKRGTLGGWQEEVAAYVWQYDPMILALGAAFAGVVVDYLKQPSVGLNLIGGTGSGKTTALSVAGSVWADPTAGQGLIYSASGTETGQENLLKTSSGTLIGFDELKRARPEAVADLVFMIAANVGRIRGTREGGVRDWNSWHTFALLSGERSLRDYVQEARQTWTPGTSARCVDINVVHERAKADRGDCIRMTTGAGRHHGHAGPAFVGALLDSGFLDDPEAIRQDLEKRARRICQSEDGSEQRSAYPLALAEWALEQAIRFGVVPEGDRSLRAVTRWAWSSFKGVYEDNALDPVELAVGSLRSWIARHWHSSFADRSVPGNDPFEDIRPPKAFLTADYIIIPQAEFTTALGGHAVQPQQVLRSLESEGLAVPRSAGKNKRWLWEHSVADVGALPHYRLVRSGFEPGGGE